MKTQSKWATILSRTSPIEWSIKAMAHHCSKSSSNLHHTMQLLEVVAKPQTDTLYPLISLQKQHWKSTISLISHSSKRLLKWRTMMWPLLAVLIINVQFSIIKWLSLPCHHSTIVTQLVSKSLTLMTSDTLLHLKPVSAQPKQRTTASINKTVTSKRRDSLTTHLWSLISFKMKWWERSTIRRRSRGKDIMFQLLRTQVQRVITQLRQRMKRGKLDFMDRLELIVPLELCLVKLPVENLTLTPKPALLIKSLA